MLDFFSLPEVASRLPTPSGPVLTHSPVSTRKNFYVHPYDLDMTNSAKYGVNGKWPSTVAVRTHFPSLVHRNYESEKEALELKFKPESHGQKLELFSAGYIDGHCKGVMVQGVFALLDYLEPQFLIVVAV